MQRVYDGAQHRIWGGEQDCKHDWDWKKHSGISGGKKSKKLGVKGRKNFQIMPEFMYAFCKRCGAWIGCLGLEITIPLYVEHMCMVLAECLRVVRPDGTIWMNIGDNYAASKKGADGNTKPKDLSMIPARVAIAARDELGLWIRNDIIWHKTNVLPESHEDRLTKAHEYIYLLTKRAHYFFDHYAILEEAKYDGRHDTIMKGAQKYNREIVPGGGIHGFAKGKHERWPQTKGGKRMRNRRTVWTMPAERYGGEHFATFPTALVELCVKAGTSEHGVCPHCGSQYERVVKKEGGTIGKGSWVDHNEDWEQGMTQRSGSRKDGSDDDGSYQRYEAGWCKPCDCPDADPIPAKVLDPFNGSGRTTAVATVQRLWAHYSRSKKARAYSDRP
jgi:DNA modification methylase